MMPKLTFILTLAAFVHTDGHAQTKKLPKKEIPASVTTQDPIAAFWKWFEANQSSIRGFEKNPDKILPEVADSIKKIQRGLAVEFEPPVNGIVTVTVSADGDKNLFPVVKKIVQKAPKIAGWTFVAFRQRFPKDKLTSLLLKAQDHELDINKMKFFPVVSGDSLDIIIFADGITEENFNQVAYGGFLMIDNILGEYDAVTKVRHYDFQQMPVTKEDLQPLQPLIKLAEYVDNFYTSKKK